MPVNPETRHDRPRGSGIGWIGLKRTTVITLAVALLFAWGLTGEYLRNREMQLEIDRLQARAAEMERKNAELEETGRTVSSEALLEREARLKMNLQKPGEQVVVVQGGTGQVRVETTSATAIAAPSNAAKWWSYFSR